MKELQTTLDSQRAMRLSTEKKKQQEKNPSWIKLINDNYINSRIQTLP